MSYFNGLQALETPEYLTARIDKLGGPESYNHYAVGWAHAMNTPYQWTKQVASHWGGTRNGTDRPLAEGHQGQGRDPLAIQPRHRRRANDPRSGRHPRAALGERHRAVADRRRQHALCVQRRQGGGAARDAVLRDVRQPRHLPPGLDRGDAAHVPLVQGKAPGARRRRLGALRHQQGLEPVEEPRQGDAGQAPRAAAALAHRGDALQRVADRRPAARESQPRPGRPPAAGRRKYPGPLRRDGAPVGELRPEHQEQVALDHGGDRACRRKGPRA